MALSAVAVAKRRAKHEGRKLAAARRRAKLIESLRKRAKEKAMPFYTGSTTMSDTTGTGSSLIWPAWNTMTASNYTATTAGIWDEWNNVIYNNAITTSAATSNQIVWGQWQGARPIGQVTNDWVFDQNGQTREAARITMQRWTAAHQETVEQREARAREEAERHRVWEAGAADRAAAQAARDRIYAEAETKRLAGHKRAMELLYLVLSTSQKKMLEEKRFFHVDAPSGRRYRIDQGNHANVKVVNKDTGAILERLCVQPDGLPDGDVMLIQKLLIETAEQAFRDTANISAYGPGGENTSSKHLLTGEKLAEILQFPQGGRKEAAERAA